MKLFFKKCFAMTAILMFSAVAFAQSRTVKGIVSATNGEALIGAGVVVKGTTNGTVTDFEGRYSLSVPENAVLEFTSIGYKTLEVNTGTKTNLDVILEDDAELLEEPSIHDAGGEGPRRRTG